MGKLREYLTIIIIAGLIFTLILFVSFYLFENWDELFGPEPEEFCEFTYYKQDSKRDGDDYSFQVYFRLNSSRDMYKVKLSVKDQSENVVITSTDEQIQSCLPENKKLQANTVINPTIKGKSYPTNLFNWEEVPGKDNDIFIKFLDNYYGDYADVDWINRAKIEKNDNLIVLYPVDLILTLNNKKNTINLTVGDVKIDTFIAKMENGDLNIYENNTSLFNWGEIPGNDSDKFIEILKEKYDIHWVSRNEINKSDDNKIIRVSPPKLDIFLKLTNNNTNVECDVFSEKRYYYYDEFIYNTSLFNWEEVPGNDSDKFIEILKEKYNLHWISRSEIKKSDDNKIISVSIPIYNIILKLTNNNTNVECNVFSEKPYYYYDEFIAKEDNSNLIIYKTLDGWVIMQVDFLDIDGHGKNNNTKKVYIESPKPESRFDGRGGISSMEYSWTSCDMEPPAVVPGPGFEYVLAIVGLLVYFLRKRNKL